MNYTVEKLNKNYEVIKQFCGEYRKELTVLAGIIGSQCGTCDYEEYVKFSDSLTDDVFAANYLGAIMNEIAIDYYRQMLNGEMTFVEFVRCTTFSESITNAYLEKMGV